MLPGHRLQRIFHEERLHRFLKYGTWEEYKETVRRKMTASEWAFDRIKEAFDLVAKDEAEKMSIVQEIMFKSTDCLRRIIALVGGQGGVAMSYLCPNCNSFPLEDYVWWVSGEKRPQSGGAQFVENSTTGGNGTGCWSCKLEKVLSRPRCSKRMRYLSTRGECSKDVWRSRSTAILSGSEWSCLLLRVVLQDALSEVTKNCPSLKLWVFCG